VSAQWKHRKAEEQLEPMLRSATKLDPELVTTYPRAVKDILCASLPVAFESHRGLTSAAIVEVLGDVYGVDHRELLEDGDTPMAGYTFARGAVAVVFSDSQYGEGFERFTVAHEAAHIAVEYLPALRRAAQPDLFGAPKAPILFARRDPPGHFLAGRDPTPIGSSDLARQYERLRADRNALLREIIANACAAELIAPHREVRSVLRSFAPGTDGVDAIQAHFGLSRRAAQVRLADLGYASHPPQHLSLFLE